MIIKNQKELEILREGGKRLAAVLNEAASSAKEGVTTQELNDFAENLILKAGGAPSFKGYKVQGAPASPAGGPMPYPGALCVSINDEVVHGLPSDRKLKNGDIIGLDIGMWYEGLCTDTALTVFVGGGKNKLINATKKSLEIGIQQVHAGAKIGDIGFAIQKYLEGEGFGVVRELVGHGVGKAVHEDPEIPNWGKKGAGPELVDGMVIALEPMATDGSPKVKLSKDGWTWLTRDCSRSAHFEHTVVVTKTGAEVLTRF